MPSSARLKPSLRIQLRDAIRTGSVNVFKRLLQEHPRLDINLPKPSWPLLHQACYQHRKEFVKILLAHPRINVNLKDKNSKTPFSVACDAEAFEVVRLLLADERVDAMPVDHFGRRPLWYMFHRENLPLITTLLASDKELWPPAQTIRLTPRLGYLEENVEDPLVMDIARHLNQDPEKVRHEFRKARRAKEAADIFALMIFLCEGLLKFRSPEPWPWSWIWSRVIACVSCPWPSDCPWNCKWSCATRPWDPQGMLS